ncbi:unnamed protein product [Effrenium voratum]|uniref:Uncharacterized protein n=1 Tax=Effrenium voratum TaxID=2562239 RepID=A0AA36NAF2_9DINO|nr:unnamed protein product [Effrenium voratum]
MSPELKEELTRLCEAGDSGEKLVCVAQQIMQLLRQNGLAHSATIPAKRIGVHHRNREGYGINVVDVQDLMHGMLSVGFCFSRVQAICVELPGADVQQCQDFNGRLLSTAGGALGHQDNTAIKHASIAGSHTNFVLRLFLDGVPSGHPDVSVEGALCLERLKMKDPSLHKACVEGLRWEVIQAVVAEQVPKTIEVIQRAGNTTLHRPEHELQCMLRMHSLWRAKRAAGLTADYAAIRKQALASQPQCSSSMPSMFVFLLRHCGGEEAPLLEETQRFVRSNSPSNRCLPAPVWAQLSHDVKGSVQQFSRFRHGLLNCAYVRQNITETTARAMSAKTNRPSLAAAEDIMCEMSRMALGLSEEVRSRHALVTATSLTEMAMCSFVLGLRHAQGEKQWKSLQAIAHDWVQVVRIVTGKDLASPWKEFAQGDDAASSGNNPTKPILSHVCMEHPLHNCYVDGQNVYNPAHVPCTAMHMHAFRMRELNADGSLKEPAVLLQEMGFEAGAHVRRRATKEEGVLDDIKGGMVRVDMGGGILAKVAIEEFLQGGWVIFSPKAGPVYLHDPTIAPPSSNDEYKAQHLLATIVCQVHDMGSELELQNWDLLQIQTKPNKTVSAKDKISRGKLVLVPCSCKVVCLPKAKSKKGPGFEVLTSSPTHTFWITPMVQLPSEDGKGQQPFVHPVWFLQASSDEQDVNMQLHYVSCKSDKTIRIPILKNTKDLQAGDMLLYLKSKEEKAVPLLATSPQKRSAEEASPKKKAKAKAKTGSK